MKIALVYLNALHPSGYPRDARWLAGHIAKAGADVTLISRTGTGNDGLNGVSVASPDELPEVALHSDVLHIWGFLAADQTRALLRVRHLRKERVTVVSPLAQLMDAHLRFKAWKKRPFFAAMKHALRSWPHAAHFFSPQEKIESLPFLRATGYFEANLGIFDESPPIDVTPTRDFFLFFGRNDIRQKGIDLLIDGYRVALKNGVDLPLVIAGQPHGASNDYLARALDQGGLRSRVEIRGPLDDDQKRDLLFNARCLFFLSRWDGPPRPIREAIALRTPVVVSPGTNMAELVREHGAGTAVLPVAADVARGLLDACTDDYSRWGRGVDDLAERLSWDRVARDYLQGYQSVVATSGNDPTTSRSNSS